MPECEVEELEEEMETRPVQVVNLVVSTRPLRHLVRIRGRSLLFGLLSLVCWVTRRLRSSFALALPPPLTQVLPPTQILPPLPSPAKPLLLNPLSKETPT